MSGFASILPYLEEGNTYRQYDFTLYYTHPVNVAVSQQKIATYLCPSMTIPRRAPEPLGAEVGGPSSYLLNEGTSGYMNYNDGVFGLNWPSFGYHNVNLGFRDIVDGTSSTLAVGETTYDFRDYLWSNSAGALAGTIRWGTARWVVGYPRIALGTTLYPLNVHRMPNIGGYTSMHGSGVHFLFVDGSVRYLSNHTDRSTLSSLSTRAGNEVVVDGIEF